MYIGLLHFHSLLRWVLLILMLAVIIKALRGRKGGLAFSDGDRKLSLFSLITAHLQLILGIALYGISPTVKSALADMGAAMKNSEQRFWAVEHISIMVIAIVAITIGYAKAKRAKQDEAKFKTLFTFFTLALLLILLSIPWPFREVGLGRGWF